MDDLKDGEWKREEGGPDQVEGKAEHGRKRESDVSKYDKAVMKRHSAFPCEAAQERAAFVFLVFGKGCEIDDQKICQRQCGERDDEEGQQAVRLANLKRKTDGRNDEGDMRGEDQFAETAVDEMKGRDGISEDEGNGRKKKEKGRQGKGEVEMDNEGDNGYCGDHPD